MTEEEFNKIPFRLVCTASWQNEHTQTYESEDGRLGFCTHIPVKKDGTFGKSRTHWFIYNRKYRSKEKFLKALKEYNPKTAKTVSINQ